VSRLDEVTQNYRVKQNALATAQAAFDTAKAEFVRVFNEEVGPVGTWDNDNDGYTYGRVERAGKVTFDYDRLAVELPDVASAVGTLQFDADLLTEYLEQFPESMQVLQGYFVQHNPTIAMMPVRETKEQEEEPDDE
jgi:hypothetical protein